MVVLRAGRHRRWSWSSFFVRLEARFSVPTRALPAAARAGAVKDGRRAALDAGTAVARPRLDGSEHDAKLEAVGAAISTRLVPCNPASLCGPRNTLTRPSRIFVYAPASP